MVTACADMAAIRVDVQDDLLDYVTAIGTVSAVLAALAIAASPAIIRRYRRPVLRTFVGNDSPWTRDAANGQAKDGCGSSSRFATQAGARPSASDCTLGVGGTRLTACRGMINSGRSGEGATRGKSVHHRRQSAHVQDLHQARSVAALDDRRVAYRVTKLAAFVVGPHGGPGSTMRGARK